MKIVTGGFGRFKLDKYSFCMPMAWFTIKYGIGPMENQIDAPRLETINKKELHVNAMC